MEQQLTAQVKPVDIDQEMRTSYLEYAMSIIVSRALPDVRDGLKPVHRRVLYAMHDMGLHHTQPYRKSARIVGEVLGKYHPHGEAAVYDAMVRMAQPFSMRNPLVDGQGNFGSVDGDSPAAMRYTEARLAPIAQDMLQDLDKQTVDFVANFDDSLQEPTVLPARLPNLLVNGSSGIAVAMATNIPPHNLSEVCDALIYLLDNYEQFGEVSVDDLMQFIKGPDFPTAGFILRTSAQTQEGGEEDSIRQAYRTGRGQITMRARAQVEELSRGRSCITVTEIPYQVNKAALVEKIASLVRSRRLEAISDLRDESDRQGMRIVIELKRGSEPRKVLNQLFKYTQMQCTFGVNTVALVDGRPRTLRLKEILRYYIEFRQEVITRRTKYELARARERAHILEGLRIALDDIDAVIATIRRSRSAETALTNLQRQFKLTEAQARAILDMQLRRLAALERRQIQEEYQSLLHTIADFEQLLASPRRILGTIKKDLQELKKQYGDERRTSIIEESAEISEEALVPKEEVLVSITQRNYIKRLPARTYQVQGRGGRGLTGRVGRWDDDAVSILFSATTLDMALFFTNQGRAFSTRVYQIPDRDRMKAGLPITNLLNLKRDERVTAALAVPEMDEAKYLVMATRQGQIKRVALSEFASIRSTGLAAMDLEAGDELGWVKLTQGNEELILVTERGQAIRFREEEVRAMGRAAAGVKAIKLQEGDRVAGADLVSRSGDLLVVTAKGYGKRTALKEYPTHSRYSKGVRTIDAQRLGKEDRIVEAKVVEKKDELTFISAKGMIMRLPAASISRQGRATRGVKVMDLREEDEIVSLAVLSGKES